MDALLDHLQWHEPTLLCQSAGHTWPYQGASNVVTLVNEPLEAHYTAWSDGQGDTQLLLVVGGSGTGKSRLLDEMTTVVRRVAEESAHDGLKAHGQSHVYCFHVALRNSTGCLLVPSNPEFEISCRMLYQLTKVREPWVTFSTRICVLYPRLCIEDVVTLLAKTEKLNKIQDMTVILCIDSFQRLDSNLQRVTAALCSFVSSSRAFPVVICASSTAAPIEQALASARQKHVMLFPPKLCGEQVLTPSARLGRQLVDDMDGHGRALEALDVALHRLGAGIDDIEPSIVVHEVNHQLSSCYGPLLIHEAFSDPEHCREVVAAVLSRRRFMFPTDRIGRMTVDELQSLALFRWTREGYVEAVFFAFQFVIQRIPTRNSPSHPFPEDFSRFIWCWQEFKVILALFRRVQSIAYGETTSFLRDTPIFTDPLTCFADFEAYFGPFASLAYRSLHEPPNINSA
ncbi:hypothetical protein Poli38472_013438 [Pythium oligandrum]|uniref:Uncharacterized protein n=1 Tax=Pythium oligandrum TaxID=41045 RepID=A0A8K1C7N8_PYTOL|nr:hypothetical protein Poli38472_013438 [Pythium oligandrum]|eukprot:TMW57964.1 hypothetical protein Poli38472_013438 [Pythium oligandrum]